MTEQLPTPSPGGYPPPPPSRGYQPPSPGAGNPPGEARRRWTEAHGVIAYTSWIRRVGANIIDRIPFVILLYACPVIALAIGDTIGDKSCTFDPSTGATSCSTSGMGPIIGAIIALIFGLVALAYWIWNWAYRQGTTGSSIGKSVLKFKVVSERSGQPIGFGLSTVRQIAHFLDGICYIGYLLPLFTAKRQTIADMIMGTVCCPIEPAPPQAPAARRSRTPWIIAGAVVVVVVVVIVAVVAFVLIGLKPASRQVVLPFTGHIFPEGVAVDSTGAVYVVDRGNNRVLELPAAATTPTALPFTGLNAPLGVAVNSAGNVYVADNGNKQVVELAAGSSTQNALPFTDLTWPYGVAVDSAGTVYVTNSQSDRVFKLAAGSSTQTDLPFVGLNAPSGVAVDNAGNVYVADKRNHRVVKLASGSSTLTVLPFTDIDPDGVAVDTAGAVYVADQDFNRVVKLPPH
ncbi:MAG: RDD family protein [Mycobacterium sp.]|nr:RDD family protein [Mycobacterium sp.]